MSRLDKYTPEQIVKGFTQMMEEGLSMFDEYTDSEIVKAYTLLMKISDPRMRVLMVQVPIEQDITDLSVIAKAIREWCLVGVKPLEGSIHPATVGENVENELSIIRVDEGDTPETLVVAFHKWMGIIRSSKSRM